MPGKGQDAIDTFKAGAMPKTMIGLSLKPEIRAEVDKLKHSDSLDSFMHNYMLRAGVRDIRCAVLWSWIKENRSAPGSMSGTLLLRQLHSAQLCCTAANANVHVLLVFKSGCTGLNSVCLCSLAGGSPRRSLPGQC